MPPHLALLLCSGFVAGLLWLERKRITEVSGALWVPTIWMMYCASKPLASWFGSGEAMEGDGSVEAGSPLDRLFLIVLLVIGAAVLSRRRLDWAAIRRNGGWLWALCAYALVSILWSEFTFVSIKRYIRFCGSVVMALMILSEMSPRVAMECVLRRTAFVLVPFSLVLIKYFPDLGVMYGRWSGERMWVGVTSQKNGLGILCFVSTFFLIWTLLRSSETKSFAKDRIWLVAHIGVLAIALLLLKGPERAYSATSLAVSFVGLCLLFGLFFFRRKQWTLNPLMIYALVILCFIYGMGIPFGTASVSSGVVEMLGRDSTFTDRDQIWRELVPIAMETPVLGLGYGGFWVRPIESGVNEAHNGYLDLMLELGVVGLALLFGFILSLCRRACKTLTEDFWWSSLTLCLVVMTLIHNSTESSFLKTSNFLWSLLVILYLLARLPSADPVSEPVPGSLAQDPLDPVGVGDDPLNRSANSESLIGSLVRYVSASITGRLSVSLVFPSWTSRSLL